MKLNASQSIVASSRDPRVLVLAGAGTGKTATSVHWVAGLIREGIPRSGVLMITFTRKAAAEMAHRVEHLIAAVPKKGPEDKVTVGTYHAVALIELRRDASAFGLTTNSFTTIDESEAHSIWRSALKQCGFGPKTKLFVPNRLHSLYSLARNTCRPMEEVFDPVYGQATCQAVQVVKSYETLKRSANCADYDDLLGLWLDRMLREPDYAERLRQRWRYVLVDEMQDNNQLNQAILGALNPEHLMVVGDANQSIYGFRGSDVNLIQDFPARNPGTRILKLENNYRSGQPILDLANTIVEKTSTPLQLLGHEGAQGYVEYHSYLNPMQEANGIINWVRERRAGGHRGSDCAILARSSKALTVLEIALNQNRIRYKKYGGLTLADAAEIKDFIAFLRVAHNAHDKLALLRALMQFPGVGEGTAARAIAEHDGGLFGNLHWPAPAEEMMLWIKELREMPGLGPKGNFLFEKIKPLVLANYDKDGEERLATIFSLVESMQTMESTLADFLDSFTFDRNGKDEHPHDAIVLSTIHSAKGLEWDGVWLIGAGSLQMPHPRAVESGEVEEERRLFYVSVTRAKRHLVISFPQTTERGQPQKPSPFVPETAEWRIIITSLPRLEAREGQPQVEGPLVALFKQLSQHQAVPETPVLPKSEPAPENEMLSL